jgi:DmsE family decaheme c-type cytochrome
MGMIPRSFRSSKLLMAASVMSWVVSALVITMAAPPGQSVPPSQATPPGQAAPAKALPESQWGAYVGVAKCTSCHEPQAKGYHAGPHSVAWDLRTPAAAKGCETCHGAGESHVADVGAKGRMRNFLKMSPRDVNEFCVTCHNREEHAQWNAGMHEARNVSCISCHSNHTSKSESKLLKKETITATCAQCHREKAAKLLGSAHMPVREGKMECTTCHNQHGSTNVRMLRVGNTVNELCTSCHTEKRGPFLWEHPPVREGCITCHDPHGSSNDRMLAAKVPFLCQRCHVATQHPATMYDKSRVAPAPPGLPSVRIIGRACVNCHSQIHGSNHPSGFRFHR